MYFIYNKILILFYNLLRITRLIFEYIWRNYLKYIFISCETKLFDEFIYDLNNNDIIYWKSKSTYHILINHFGLPG